MEKSNKQDKPMTVHEFTDALVRVGLLAMMVILCFRIFNPFLNLMLWALILAVTLSPLHQKLAFKMSGKQGRAATLIVLLGIVLIVFPVVKLAGALAQNMTSLHEAYEAGTLALPAPQESVAEWPVIGQQAYTAWQQAADNLPKFIEDNKTTIESLVTKGVAMAKSAAGTIFLFLGALIVAGVMMAFSENGSRAMLSILARFAGPEGGPEVHKLATMTTRSVAVGVLGVALIQGILMGLGFLLAGVPAAGLLALIVLLLAIMQLPATLVGIPVIIWLWNSGDAGTTMNVVWSVYIIVAGLSDNFLKPVLLGRGVDAPMPVILIGALGGMMSAGFIGLFLGAVVLAVGYQIFMRWVDRNPAVEQTAGDPAEAAE
jgi:predicted PurR-regulated permease PerM